MASTTPRPWSEATVEDETLDDGTSERLMDELLLDTETYVEGGEGYVYVTPEGGRRLFDELARKVMGMSGEEFIRRWEAGEYWGIADEEGHRHIGDLIAMIPLARQEP